MVPKFISTYASIVDKIGYLVGRRDKATINNKTVKTFLMPFKNTG